MNRIELADLLLPNINHNIEYYENLYPERNLPEGAIVSRYAPSPTGFVHMGNLFASFLERKVVKDASGVFFLRIEDTDQKRRIENGIVSILTDLENYGITFDEGRINETEEKGNYGPYVQSERKEIYQAFAKYLIEKDLAYPCFCTEEQLNNLREKQEERKERIGYYCKWSECRNLPIEDIVERVETKTPYIIRLKSPGSFEKKIVVNDLVKGKVEFPENDLDIVIIKADGLPTYHFAHLVDDHLMRTTHVIRADEWLSSLPVHIQLFQMFGYKILNYAHLSPLMKEENGNKRKLSKRKDPEAAVSYYHKQGIPKEAVKTYIMTVANSNFEIWMEQNPNLGMDDFKFDFKKVSTSGSLFDLNKLLNISKNYISKLKASEVYEQASNYAKEFDTELYDLLNKYKDYSINLFNIEREQKKPRKDYSCYSDIKNQIWYMFDELFYKNEEEYEFQTIKDKEEIKHILSLYMSKYYNEIDDKDTWFNKIKALAIELGYAGEVKEYKDSPDKYKGHVGDICMVLRVSLTKKATTPDLYEMMKLFGKERISKRYDI